MTDSVCVKCEHGQIIHDRGVCTLDKNTIDTYNDFLVKCAAARHHEEAGGK